MAYITEEQFKAIADPDLRACALVGYFLQTYASVEFRLDTLITRGLGLKSYQGTILAKNIDMRRKMNIAKVLADIQNVDPKLFKKAFARLHGFADERNTAAHDFFIPSIEGVEFFKALAKEKLEYPETVWTIKKITQMVEQLVECAGALDELANQLDPVSLSKLLREPRNALLDLINDPPETTKEAP